MPCKVSRLQTLTLAPASGSVRMQRGAIVSGVPQLCRHLSWVADPRGKRELVTLGAGIRVSWHEQAFPKTPHAHSAHGIHERNAID